jgi:dUTP pyrophosphatase
MKIKPLVENFIAPERKNNSAGIDIFLQNDVTLQVGKDNIIGLGFASEFPENQVALLIPRSSAGVKGIHLRNTIGVIDADYRGEWMAHITIDEVGTNAWGTSIPFKKGDRLLQAIMVPVITEKPEIVEELSDTTRSEGGFGSTGE